MCWEQGGKSTNMGEEKARALQIKWQRCHLWWATEKDREDTAVKAQVRHKGEERNQLGKREGRRRAGEILGSWNRVCLLRNDGKIQWAHTSSEGGGEGREGARGSLAAKSINT